MEVVDIVGTIALIVTLTHTGVGLPIQIYKNFQAKSTKGLSLSMVILLFLTILTWLTYGIVKTPMDWYIILSNSFGFISVAIILFQFWIYRNRIVPTN
jgi:uncharacterized protein with PQ loop repeat